LFNWASRHEGVSGSSRGIAPRILDLGTRWRWMVSLTPRPLYPQGKSPWYPLDRRLSGPQSRSGRGRAEKNSRPLPGLEPPIIQPVAQLTVTTKYKTTLLTELLGPASRNPPPPNLDTDFLHSFQKGFEPVITINTATPTVLLCRGQTQVKLEWTSCICYNITVILQTWAYFHNSEWTMPWHDCPIMKPYCLNIRTFMTMHK
jgi:hypothetical protein